MVFTNLYRNMNVVLLLVLAVVLVLGFYHEKERRLAACEA